METDFKTRASNLLFDLVHKIGNDELKECEFILKRLSEEIVISLNKIKR